jgi:hypothetical protein
MISSRSADTLNVSLVPFRDKVQEIVRRGKTIISTMEREGYPDQRIELERTALAREILDLRIRTSQAFSETLLAIVRENE